MIVHLIDGTYELFRQFYGQQARHAEPSSRPFDAARGVVDECLRMLESGATHLGVATDHVIESFRNDLWAGYKTGEGVDPALRSQFEPLEEALAALGVAVWPLVEFEADDGLAAAAAVAAADDRVDTVVIWTVDKDLGQCVGGKVVQHDRKSGKTLDPAAVREKFGVSPESIPDYLALVGDSADGFPGLPGWGAKSAGAVLRRYGTIEAIPDAVTAWDVEGVRGAAKLATTLAAGRDVAERFKVLATLRTDVPVGTVDDWEWRGPTPELKAWAERFEAPHIAQRAQRLADSRT
ncbi:MAG TPA: 5'-3' exonuclease H3TH domain-containing protein [Acidimicrobiia bacterium]